MKSSQVSVLTPFASSLSTVRDGQSVHAVLSGGPPSDGRPSAQGERLSTRGRGALVVRTAVCRSWPVPSWSGQGTRRGSGSAPTTWSDPFRVPTARSPPRRSRPGQPVLATSVCVVVESAHPLSHQDRRVVGVTSGSSVTTGCLPPTLYSFHWLYVSLYTSGDLGPVSYPLGWLVSLGRESGSYRWSKGFGFNVFRAST